MLAEKLKEQTKAAHIELEKALVQKIKSITTIDDYLQILIYFYWFFDPLEANIRRQLEHVLPDINERRKMTWLEEDIQALASAAQPIKPFQELPFVQNQQQAFGTLYVIEGSTLGGQVISKMILQRIPELKDKGLRFFSGYGENTMKMWNEFKDYLNSRPWTTSQEEEIIAAANATFNLFKHSFA